MSGIFMRMIENPTWKQQTTIRNIVYLIHNNITNKNYVGQTVTPFGRRYGKNSWLKKASNKYFESSIKKYGVNNFTITFLKYGLEKAEDRDYWEKFYIKEYNCKFPNGYNFDNGGAKITEERRELLSRAQLKTYIFKNQETGHLVPVDNLPDFCKIKNLKIKEMRRVATGYRKRYNEWVRPDYDENLHERKLKSPDGKIHSILINKTPEFCLKNNLEPYCISCVFQKKNIHHKGWTLPETEVKYYEIYSPEGKMFKIPKLIGFIASFCQEHNINKFGIAQILRGHYKSSQGWSTDKNLVSSRVRERMNDINYELISPNKEKIILNHNNIEQFCKEQKLSERYFRRVLNKETINHCGWYLSETPMEYFRVINPKGEQVLIPKIDGEIRRFSEQNGLPYRKATYFIFNKAMKTCNGWTKPII